MSSMELVIYPFFLNLLSFSPVFVRCQQKPHDIFLSQSPLYFLINGCQTSYRLKACIELTDSNVDIVA